MKKFKLLGMVKNLLRNFHSTTTEDGFIAIRDKEPYFVPHIYKIPCQVYCCCYYSISLWIEDIKTESNAHKLNFP